MMDTLTPWVALVRVEMGSFDKVGGQSKASGYLCGRRLLASILQLCTSRAGPSTFKSRQNDFASCSSHVLI